MLQGFLWHLYEQYVEFVIAIDIFSQEKIILNINNPQSLPNYFLKQWMLIENLVTGIYLQKIAKIIAEK